MAREYQHIGVVTGLNFYPLKSCKGIAITEASCNEYGIVYDRHWTILDRGGRMVTLRSNTALVHIIPTFVDGFLKVEAPGMEPLFVPLSVAKEEPEIVDVELFGMSGSGIRVSKEADEWLSKYLGKPHSLLVFDSTRCIPRKLTLHMSNANKPYIHEKDKVAFSDGCPYLLISEESLEELNKNCAKFKCSMERFRPNIVIKGGNAFEEDQWNYLKIGTSEFRCLHRCGRCTVPNVDPETGLRDSKEPLQSLRSFRLVPKEEDPSFGNSPVFGRNLGIETPGSVKVGDIVYGSK
eukprot:gene10211-18892_t